MICISGSRERGEGEDDPLHERVTPRNNDRLVKSASLLQIIRDRT